MKTISTITIAALAAGAQANVCGVTGYNSQDSYYYDDSDGQGSYAACSQICLNDNSCQALAYNSDTCMLFSQSLSADTFTADDSSSDTFYDASCLTSVTSSSTTTSIMTFTSTAASTSSTATGVVIPSGCPTVPTSQIMTTFSWFNSTHNLDCFHRTNKETGCLSSTTGTWCDPKTEQNCTNCGIGLCMTGLPPQPVGYGPPDRITIGIGDYQSCSGSNPAGFRDSNVGEGGIRCGPAGRCPIIFVGNSNKDNTTGTVSYGTVVQCADRPYIAYYQTSFPITCTHDSGFNATCASSNGSINVPLTSFYPGSDYGGDQCGPA